ncbi:hypothetical protein vseg_015440 [Gypsophila vaccaria]
MYQKDIRFKIKSRQFIHHHRDFHIFHITASTSGAHSDNGEGGSYYHIPPLPPPLPLLQNCGTDGQFQSSVPNPIVPESFEEQMILAMAVSSADARARTTAEGVAWQ